MRSIIFLSKEKLHLSANDSDHKDIFIAPFFLGIDDHSLPFHELSFRMSGALRKHNRFLRHQYWDEMTILYTKY